MEWGSKMGTALGGSCSSGIPGEEVNQAALGGEWAVDGGWAMDGWSSPRKVMTDEQIEVLRKQISAYATICEKLVEAHSVLVASQPNSSAGMKLGNLYDDSLITTGQKIPTRQRWNPTRMQLQILEDIFDRGNGAPNRQKIKEITAELSKHGQISETNVYNWFQNRRARHKRKRMQIIPYNAESEADNEVNSPAEENATSRSASLHEPDPASDGVALNNPGNDYKVRFLDLASSSSRPHGNFSSEGAPGSAQYLCLASFCDGFLNDNSVLQQSMESTKNQGFDSS